MNFKTQKIKKERKPRKPLNLKLPNLQLPEKFKKFLFGAAASVLVIIVLLYVFYLILKSIGLNALIPALGTDLQEDSYGHTNFLILGHGGENHDGGNLMDSIIVASLDGENQVATMTSIPRDLFIQDELIGNWRINQTYDRAEKHFGTQEEAMNYTQKKIEELMGIPIHYWVKVDFQGFSDLIDAVGGVEVIVKQTINDPFYPKDGTTLFEPFYLQAGIQTLDGATALKYARSRKTTSDFDRADRQQQLIYALKQKAVETNIITDLDKIEKIYSALKKNLSTNLTVREMITLGGLAKDFQSEKIHHRLIHDDPTHCGGFLYVPPQDLYGGAYVQLIAGGKEFIQKYSDLNFNQPQIAVENKKITILNGTPTTGVANEVYRILNRFCFTIEDVANARNKEITTTTYYFRPDLNGNPPSAINFLQKLIPGETSNNIPLEYEQMLLTSDIILELGSDYINSENYLQDPFNSIVFP